MAELFGFSITRLKKQADPKQSFTQPQADDGTQTVAAGGYFGQYLDMEGQAKTFTLKKLLNVFLRIVNNITNLL